MEKKESKEEFIKIYFKEGTEIPLVDVHLSKGLRQKQIMIMALAQIINNLSEKSLELSNLIKNGLSSEKLLELHEDELLSGMTLINKLL